MVDISALFHFELRSELVAGAEGDFQNREFFQNRELGGLNISSNELRKFFLKHQIVPWVRYPHLFSHSPPTAHIEYEWKLTFSDIQKYFAPECIATFNKLYGGKGVTLPYPVESLSVWIDIFFVKQFTVNMYVELESAAKIIEACPIQLILQTPTIFKRGWVLHDIALRGQVDKPACLLRLPRDYFLEMEASRDEDKTLIRNRILELHGSPAVFNQKVYELQVGIVSKPFAQKPFAQNRKCVMQ